MASEIKYNRSELQHKIAELKNTVKAASEEALKNTLGTIVEDAKYLARWHDPGEHSRQYGNTLWEWVTTGMASESIQAYIVPNKRLKQLPFTVTTSKLNGVPKLHPHYTTNQITGTYGSKPDVVTGIITMNVYYAPYLQRWELDTFGDTAIVLALKLFWKEYKREMGADIRRRMKNV